MKLLKVTDACVCLCSCKTTVGLEQPIHTHMSFTHTAGRWGPKERERPLRMEADQSTLEAMVGLQRFLRLEAPLQGAIGGAGKVHVVFHFLYYVFHVVLLFLPFFGLPSCLAILLLSLLVLFSPFPTVFFSFCFSSFTLSLLLVLFSSLFFSYFFFLFSCSLFYYHF